MRATSLVRRPQPVRTLPRRGPERGVRGADRELDGEVAVRADVVAAAEVLHEGEGRQDRERRRVRLRRVAVAGVAQTMEDRYVC